MGSIDDGAEDRISNMPEDIVHHILSFLDTKYDVQFCTLSPKWKDIWTSMRHLNFSNDTFSSVSKFDKFMDDAFSHRNNQTEVDALKLRFTGHKILDVVIDTVEYANLHNVKQLTIELGKVYELPPCLFSSPTLKHLSLSGTSLKSRIPDSALNMPALETLYLSDIRFGDIGDMSFNLFHECVKLTSLTLEHCAMFDLEILYVCAPNLLSLTITRTSTFPKVFHVFSPQLETLTAGGYSSSSQFLKLSTEEGFSSLEKVNLSLSRNLLKRDRHVPSLLDLFKKVSSVKSLILDVNITEMLASSMDELSHKPCPFYNLKCLKINTATWKGKVNIPTISPEVRNYLLRNSPNATFIVNLPPKVTKLAAEEKKTETLAEEERLLEAELQKLNQQIPYQAKLQMLNLHDPCQNAVFGAKPHMHDQLNAKKKTMVEAQDQSVSNKNAMFELHNVYNQSHAHADELRGAPRPSSANLNMAPLKQRDSIPTSPIHVGNRSLEKASNATFVMDSPLQVPQKRSRQQLSVDTTANKVPKLYAKTEQPETMANENRILKEKLQKKEQLIANYKEAFRSKIQRKEQRIATLEAQNSQYEKLIPLIIISKIFELKVQVESGNPHYHVIRSLSSEIKSVMDLIHGSLRVDMEAQFSLQYEKVKSMLYNRINATEWAMIETEMGLINLFGKMQFNNISSQSHVHATELPRPPRPSSANVASSSKSVDRKQQ